MPLHTHVHIPTPGTCGYSTLHSKRDLAEGIILVDPIQLHEPLLTLGCKVPVQGLGPQELRTVSKETYTSVQ